MRIPLFIQAFIFSLLFSLLSAQEDPQKKSDDYYSDNFLRYENYVYKKNIKTVLLYEQQNELSPPVIKLNTDQRLLLGFDDLEGDLKNYYYTVVHCDARWQPSDILSNEYLDGFTEDQIRDYQYSFNTLQKYTHYTVYFPNSGMRITKTGNYLLKVYLDNNPENLVITRRFMVYEDKIQIIPDIHAATIVENRFSRQEVDFTILYENYPITNPYGDLKVVITQNDRWDNAVYDLKPLFVKDKQLVFDYDHENVFIAGNEFRNFSMKSLRYQTEHIDKIQKDSNENHVYLLPDEKRNIKQYAFNQDINGKYVIRFQEGRNPDKEADYAWVHFYLPMYNAVTEGNLFIFGGLSDWKCSNEFKMHFNETLSRYECAVFLKQGFYDYEYVLNRDGTGGADPSFIEGSHYETQSDYTIYVYHRAHGTYYDQLIGVKRSSSIY